MVGLAAARSRSRSDSPPGCHSFRSRRFATHALAAAKRTCGSRRPSVHKLTNPMRKTKRESTSSPNVAISKTFLLGKFFGRGVGRPFFQKRAPHKKCHAKSPTKKRSKPLFCWSYDIQNSGRMRRFIMMMQAIPQRTLTFCRVLNRSLNITTPMTVIPTDCIPA